MLSTPENDDGRREGAVDLCRICGMEFAGARPPYCAQCGWDLSAAPGPHASEKERGHHERRAALMHRLWTEREHLIACRRNLQAELDRLRGHSRFAARPENAEIEMVDLPAGRFIMGSEEEEDERPPHEVHLDPFAMGRHLVTQDQWLSVMGSNPSKFAWRGDLPVEWVCWNDAQCFIVLLNRATGMTYRLPTEAEWEYACRAGSTTRFCCGDGEEGLVDYGWFKRNSGYESHPVGQKRANVWGLYDMHGNVFEWCQDWYRKDYYHASGKRNPVCDEATSGRKVLRGGGWSDKGDYCRSASRLGRSPKVKSYHIGFRLAFSL
jgi:formylglycine-generating enzyme required for sulfatase activity